MSVAHDLKMRASAGRTPSSAPRQRNLRSRRGGEQELFQRRTCRLLQSTPLIDGYEDSHLHSSPSDDLGPFGNAGLQQFTEAGFGVLHRPRSGFFFCATLPTCQLVIELVSFMIPPFSLVGAAVSGGGVLDVVDYQQMGDEMELFEMSAAARADRSRQGHFEPQAALTWLDDPPVTHGCHRNSHRGISKAHSKC